MGKSQIDKINEKMKGCTSSSNHHEYHPEITKTKEENSLERTKRKLKQEALEWDDLDIQAQLKSFMYVDRSLRGDPKKDKLINQLNFKKCMQLKRIQKTSSLLLLHKNKQSLSLILNLWLPTIKLKISLIIISKVTQTRFMT